MHDLSVIEDELWMSIAYKHALQKDIISYRLL